MPQALCPHYRIRYLLDRARIPAVPLRDRSLPPRPVQLDHRSDHTGRRTTTPIASMEGCTAHFARSRSLEANWTSRLRDFADDECLRTWLGRGDRTHAR